MTPDVLATLHPDDAPAAPARRFDGIVCFGGEDWWYHNRGHFDMQIMRRLAIHAPVLYVNSLGMRMPSAREGRMFVARLRRKLRSIRRGFVEVGDSFAVLSPPYHPGPVGATLTRGLLHRSVRRAMDRLGIARPLAWVACPAAAHAALDLAPAGLVYQRTDRYEAFAGVDPARVEAWDQLLKREADLVVHCARPLHEAEAGACRRAALVEHGVDFERFVAASRHPERAPADVDALPRPRVGFVGGIDAHTFDPDLLEAVAAQMPDVAFVLVGGCSLPPTRLQAPNIHQLGRRPYADVPAYMAACDVLIMPWRRSSWIASCSPVKLREYLATGRPIVSTPYPDLAPWLDLVRSADDAPGFAAAIRAALEQPRDPAAGRRRVRRQTWELRAEEVLEHLRDAGLVPSNLDASTGSGPRTSARDDAAELEPAEVDVAESIVRVPAGVETGRRVAAVILLAGGIAPDSLARATGMCALDLWIGTDATVLDLWLERVAEIDRMLLPDAVVRVVRPRIGPRLRPRPTRHAARRVHLETEPVAYRGLAGLLRDLAETYAPDDDVLVLEGARVLDGSLRTLVRRHLETAADLTLAVNPDRTPAGMMLVRAGALAGVAADGFVDLKEQFLPRLRAAGGRTLAVELPRFGSMPLRSREELLAAAAVHQRRADPAPDAEFGAAGRLPVDGGGVRVICAGALVGPNATIVDSILMPGCVVGADATIVRSVICPGTRVQPGADLADAVIRAGATSSSHRAVAGGFVPAPDSP